MRAVIYTRVSSDPMATGRSVEQQEAECRQICDRNGWTVVQVFTDNDRSASRYARKDRPAYAQVKQAIADSRADVLVLWEGSRAQRDLRDYLKLRDLCAQQGVLYCYSGKVHDLTRTDDRFTTGLDALLAEREADLTRDRVLRAVRANMATGRPYGRTLYGYRRVYDAQTRQFLEQVPHEEHAPVVREAARRVMAGESCRAIALDFNARGIAAPAGGAWDLTQIKRLVIRPAYAGQKVHRGQVVGSGDWPALLDEQTYAACVARLSDPRRRTQRDGSVKHLLSGAGRCGACGGRLRVQKNRSHLAYLCVPGFCVSMKTTTLENYVTDVILERLSRPDAIDLLSSPASDDQVAQARAERDELTARLESFYEQAAAGQLSSTGLAKMEARLLPQIEAATSRAQPVPVPQVLRDLVGDRTRVRDAWGRLDIAVRREIVMILMEVRLRPLGRGAKLYERLSSEDTRGQFDEVELAELWGKRVEIAWKSGA